MTPQELEHHIADCGWHMECAASKLIRRARYVALFIYWSIRHRSVRHVCWVLAFEGYSWN
jgi:hypothetical protein